MKKDYFNEIRISTSLTIDFIFYIIIFFAAALLFSCKSGIATKSFPDVMVGTWAKKNDKMGASISKENNDFYFTDNNANRYPLGVNTANSSLSLQLPMLSLNMKYVNDIDAVIVSNVNTGRVDTTYRLK